MGYGEIKSAMINKDVQPVGVDLLTPDFAALAKCWGMNACKPESAGELAVLLRDASNSLTPTLIELDETMFLQHFQK